MFHYEYETKGSCARLISFDIDEDNKLHNVQYIGGCPGNLASISQLIEGMDIDEVTKKLSGIDCGGKGTSCQDQLTKGIIEAIKARGN